MCFIEQSDMMSNLNLHVRKMPASFIKKKTQKRAINGFELYIFSFATF